MSQTAVESAEVVPLKKKIGRPSKFQPEWCDRVIELGKSGFSLVQMACDLEIDWSNFHRIQQTNKEFRNAVSLARDYSCAYFEEKARNGIECREFNAKLWEFIACNRFPTHYRPTNSGTTVNVNNNNLTLPKEFLDRAKQFVKVSGSTSNKQPKQLAADSVTVT